MESAIAKKELVVRSGLRLLELGLVERTWGNVSSRLGDKHFAITPSGVSYTSLLVSDIVLVDIHTLNFTTTEKPSSELHIHAKIYANFPDINFVLHTHQKWASLLSLFCASKVGVIKLPTKYHDVLGQCIPCAEYAQAGTEEIADNVIDAVMNAYSANFRLSFGVVLMASHGVVIFTKDENEAFSVVEKLEFVARKIVQEKLSIALSLGHSLSAPDFDASLCDQLFDITKDKTSFCNNRLSQLFSFLTDSRILVSGNSCFFAPFSNSNIISYVTNICYTQDDILHANNVLPFSYKMMAYFDDVAQIAGTFFTLLDLTNDQIFLKDMFWFFEDSNVVILKDYGVLVRSPSSEDAYSTIRLLEKNAYAFLLSLCDANILPLSATNAKELHISYLKGYSKLKDK